MLLSQGQTIQQAARALEISEQTYYRWRKEYGGMDKTQARRLKELEQENARGCLATVVERHLTHDDVLACLTRLFCQRGIPAHICSDNGSEFTAKAVRAWLTRLEVAPLFIDPGSPWENGYVESFNGKMRDELLAREIFYSLQEAQILIEAWRVHSNQVRPHSALGYQPPAPAAILDPLCAQSLSLTLVP